MILIPKGWTNHESNNAPDAWEWLQKQYPAIAKYLEPHADAAKKRSDKGDYWWELRACSYYEAFRKPKIVYPEIARESRFAFDYEGFYCNKTTFIIPQEELYLLGVLNSKLAWAFLKKTCSVLGDPEKGGRLLMQYIYLKQLPIHRIDFADPAEKSAHDEIVNLVEQMLELQKQHQQAEAAKEDARFALQKRIQELDKGIDAHVYHLYGLTQDEIKVVEGG